MHQMRISTNQIFSVVLRPKKLEIRKIVKTVKDQNRATPTVTQDLGFSGFIEGPPHLVASFDTRGM
jgi:hypothetical protein